MRLSSIKALNIINALLIFMSVSSKQYFYSMTTGLHVIRQEPYAQVPNEYIKLKCLKLSLYITLYLLLTVLPISYGHSVQLKLLEFVLDSSFSYCICSSPAALGSSTLVISRIFCLPTACCATTQSVPPSSVTRYCDRLPFGLLLLHQSDPAEIHTMSLFFSRIL